MAKSKEELISMIENDLVDPSTNKITGERVKNALTEMVDAMGTGSGASQMEYWSFPIGMTGESQEVAMFSSLFKAVNDGNTGIWPATLLTILAPDPELCVGLAFDRNLKVSIPGEGTTTIGEYMDGMGIDVASFGGVLVTEEEFYTI